MPINLTKSTVSVRGSMPFKGLINEANGVIEMLNKIVKINLLLIFLGLLTACAGSQVYHENIMRGQVIGIDNDEIIVCVGRENGAQEGQELQVRRYVWEGAVEDGDDNYRVYYIGTLKIKSVVNDHFARAVSTKGDVKKNDIVELKNDEK